MFSCCLIFSSCYTLARPFGRIRILGLRFQWPQPLGLANRRRELLRWFTVMSEAWQARENGVGTRFFALKATGAGGSQFACSRTSITIASWIDLWLDATMSRIFSPTAGHT